MKILRLSTKDFLTRRQSFIPPQQKGAYVTLQELAQIAARYFTAMADAMLEACALKSLETGEPLKAAWAEAKPKRTDYENSETREAAHLLYSNRETKAAWKRSTDARNTGANH